jgi:lipoprotein-anchoring transpeptidase ErfK/SrfK
VGGHRISIAAIASERFWQIAVLTVAGTIGFASSAEAARYYWSYYEPGYWQGRPAAPPQQRRRVRPRPAKTVVAPAKQSVKPQGPLFIAISIEKQSLKVYDANGFFAETPISTGTKGHPTPMGVFSIIQKRKHHHSNIYSGAPMPFMQRITWSGIAMHAGVLPGYPASHGCIRMPMAFAANMWNWTRTGARVVITPGEITPARFSHPLLAERKVLPQPAVATEPASDAPPAAKADKAAAADAAIEPAMSEASLQLRSTVGHDDAAKPVMAEASASRPWHDRTRTADASRASVTMSDAGSSASQNIGSASPREAVAAVVDKVPPVAADAASAMAGDAKAEASASASATPGETKIEAKAEDGKTETPRAEAPEISKKPGGSATAASDAHPAAPDVTKDQTRPPNADKAAVAKPEPPKPAGRIAVFVSRKDGKLYVRENFKPLFEVPVTIAPSDRLLGTHVFTAQVDKDDANVLRWSVASLPVSARNGQKNDDQRSSRRRGIAGAAPAEMKPLPAPNSPAEALDRITIPPEAMARIAEALGSGGSIVVSDQGINQGGETGEGTDFIVSLR